MPRTETKRTPIDTTQISLKEITPAAAAKTAEFVQFRAVTRVPRTPALVISIFAGNTGVAVVYDALPPILPALSAHFGGGAIGDLVAQLVSTLAIFGLALSGLFAGFLIERWGVKRILLVGLLTFALAGSAGLFIDSALALLGTRFLVGLATGTMLTCGASLIAANYRGIEQARMTGRMFSLGAVCAAAFVLVSGALASISWRAPFLMHGAFAAFFLVPALLLKSPESAEVSGVAGSAVGNLRRLRPAAFGYCLVFAVVLINNLFNIQITFLLSQVGVTAPGTIAVVCVGNVISLAVAGAAYGWVESHLGFYRTAQIAFTALALGAGVCATSSGALPILLGASIGGAGGGLGVTGMMSLIMRRVPVKLAPRALGFATTMMFLGASAAPLIFSPIRAVVGLPGVYLVVATAILIALALHRLASAPAGRTP
jgi:MFS family permease